MAHELSKLLLDSAARAAWRGFGDTQPNPLVGAVIARGSDVLAIGHHRRYGGWHAEREAIELCVARGLPTAGSTMYVTLEPCGHTGKQPPCVEAIVAAGIARVVYAAADPNPLAAGGAELLREAGVAVELCDVSRWCRILNAPFLKRVRTGLPWVVAKWAQTIDGRVATRSGESKWISGELSRSRVHRLRSRVDAIVTGIGTVLADDPMLTARGVRRVRRVARRVVCDTDLDIPLDSGLVRTALDRPTTIVCASELASAEITAQRRSSLAAAGIDIVGVPAGAVGVDLEAMLRELVTRYGVATVMVEAGPGLVGSFLSADLIDEAVVYVAPLLLGDEQAKSAAAGRVAESLTNGRRMELVRVKALGSDVELVYRRAAR
ncbi:MAG: bifunctional diaminohydroxyphosphoribosylaminopyrimidine deaminase/5-amino-6-(5-phosphoribosylamino)uracil reductase RibD [Planctomycetota bacterium]